MTECDGESACPYPQKSEITTTFQQKVTRYPASTALNAGISVYCRSRQKQGDNFAERYCDYGSQLKGGGNFSLDAANDVLVSGAANTQKQQEQEQPR